MKIYISGKISGLPTEDVKAKFEKAEKQVEAFGHLPVNPFSNGLANDASWEEHMAKDIYMLLGCDGIYLLKDWSDSVGSRIEAYIAQERGFEIIHQPEYAI